MCDERSELLKEKRKMYRVGSMRLLNTVPILVVINLTSKVGISPRPGAILDDYFIFHPGTGTLQRNETEFFGKQNRDDDEQHGD